MTTKPATHEELLVQFVEPEAPPEVRREEIGFQFGLPERGPINQAELLAQHAGARGRGRLRTRRRRQSRARQALRARGVPPEQIYYHYEWFHPHRGARRA